MNALTQTSNKQHRFVSRRAVDSTADALRRCVRSLTLLHCRQEKRSALAEPPPHTTHVGLHIYATHSHVGFEWFEKSQWPCGGLCGSVWRVLLCGRLSVRWLWLTARGATWWRNNLCWRDRRWCDTPCWSACLRADVSMAILFGCHRCHAALNRKQATKATVGASFYEQQQQQRMHAVRMKGKNGVRQRRTQRAAHEINTLPSSHVSVICD